MLEHKRSAAKTIHRQKTREWKKNNPDSVREHDRAWRLRNPNKVKEVRRRSKENHPAQWRKWKREWARVQRLTNPAFRILAALRTRLRNTVKAQKSSSAPVLVGCSVERLLGHLESQFYGGMTWRNYGKVWHIDHRKPCAAFDLTHPSQQTECFHYKNLQPLLVKDNLAKGAAWV